MHNVVAGSCAADEARTELERALAGLPYDAREPTERLCCELAYSGLLFWLPLVACPRAEGSRLHANQGVWVLVCEVVACGVMSALAAAAAGATGMAGALLGMVCALAYVLLSRSWCFSRGGWWRVPSRSTGEVGPRRSPSSTGWRSSGEG